MSSLNCNSTSEIEILIKPSDRITSSLKLKRKNNRKIDSNEILELEENESKDVGIEKNIVSNDVRTKPLFVWMLKTPVEKIQKDSKNKVKGEFNETTFNVTDHDLSNYRNAHLVGQTSTIFVKGIDINAMEDDIKEFFLDVEKPLEIRYKCSNKRSFVTI